MKHLTLVVGILLIAAGCSTTTPKPVPARPMKNRIDGWDAINRNNVAAGYCPYATMDETHRRLHDQQR